MSGPVPRRPTDGALVGRGVWAEGGFTLLVVTISFLPPVPTLFSPLSTAQIHCMVGPRTGYFGSKSVSLLKRD